jgi:hypothetical protein
MKTEADVAAHLGVSACIIYAQSFSTVSSVIPSFSKRGDIIVADKAVNYAVRKGIQISRSTVRWYEHNDMEDLENVLKKVVKEQAKKPLTRRFIITEGLFENIGDVVNLPKLVRLPVSFSLPSTKLTPVPDRTQTQVQIPPNPRRNLVLRRPRPHRPRRHRSAKRRRHRSRHDHRLSLGPSLRRGRLLRGQRRSRRAPAHLVGVVHVLGRPARAALDDGQRDDFAAARTARAADGGARERESHAGPAGPAQRLGVHAQRGGQSDACVDAEARGRRGQEAQSRGPGSDLQRCRGRSIHPLFPYLIDAANPFAPQCLANGVLITRVKAFPLGLGVNPRDAGWQPAPSLKVCVTSGLTKKETEKAGTIVRHAVTKIMARRK